jgi:hypothetical protein
MVIYTGTGSDNAWHIFAARDNLIGMFDAPPR